MRRGLESRDDSWREVWNKKELRQGKSMTGAGQEGMDLGEIHLEQYEFTCQTQFCTISKTLIITGVDEGYTRAGNTKPTGHQREWADYGRIPKEGDQMSNRRFKIKHGLTKNSDCAQSDWPTGTHHKKKGKKATLHVQDSFVMLDGQMRGDGDRSEKM